MPSDPLSLSEGILKPIGAMIGLMGLFRYMPTGASPGKIVVWSIACSLASGAIWAGLVHWSRKGRFAPFRKTVGFFGGNSKEPNGPESLIFTLVVFGPLVLAGIYLTSNSRANYPLPGFIGYFFGTAAGAFIFYGYGLRERVLQRRYSHFKRETWLVFSWALLLSLFGFGGEQVALALAFGHRMISPFVFFTQIVLVVGILCITVTAFVALFKSDKYEKERGMFAGGFLALGSLLALLVREPADLIAWLGELLRPL